MIDDRLFVALAVMAFLTSLLAGPAMSRLLGPAAQSDLSKAMLCGTCVNTEGLSSSM